MAKLKGPLFSLGASQQLGKALVFFGWKGLDVVREYVIPANPNSTLQQTQRGYLKSAVEVIHTAQGLETNYLGAADQTALALWASAVQAATTWFNQAVRTFLDQARAGKSTMYLCQGEIDSDTPLELTLTGKFYPNGTSEGKLYYGLSKTSMPNSVVCNVTAGTFTAPAITTVKGIKYFLQWRANDGTDYEGLRSGIYHAIST